MIEPRNPFETADDGVTDLQEQVGTLLEDADLPTATVDAIMKLTAAAEREKVANDHDTGFAGDDADAL